VDTRYVVDDNTSCPTLNSNPPLPARTVSYKRNLVSRAALPLCPSPPIPPSLSPSLPISFTSLPPLPPSSPPSSPFPRSPLLPLVPLPLLHRTQAELTHGRVCMLAAIGILVGEAVEGSSFLFDAQITGRGFFTLSFRFQLNFSTFWGILGEDFR